jgi:hypothetical protein
MWIVSFGIFTNACGSNSTSTRKCRLCFPGRISSMPVTTVPWGIPDLLPLLFHYLLLYLERKWILVLNCLNNCNFRKFAFFITVLFYYYVIYYSIVSLLYNLLLCCYWLLNDIILLYVLCDCDCFDFLRYSLKWPSSWIQNFQAWKRLYHADLWYRKRY